MAYRELTKLEHEQVAQLLDELQGSHAGIYDIISQAFPESLTPMRALLRMNPPMADLRFSLEARARKSGFDSENIYHGDGS
jgi:hypothetical protein